MSGMARQDSSSDHGENSRVGEPGSGGSPRKKVTISENYELVGVVVHSGQAHAGHYYSFIKDRRSAQIQHAHHYLLYQLAAVIQVHSPYTPMCAALVTATS